jgi:peptide alpha-N-acetyltransferase
MDYSHNAMNSVQGCKFVSLHVRVSNRAALGLYKDKLKYEVHSLSKEYYADGEDAYEMRKELGVTT